LRNEFLSQASGRLSIEQTSAQPRSALCSLANIFYTLLYHDADGYRREDLSEGAWRNRNENIRPFSFWKSRYEPLPPKPAEPVLREDAEQLFRRLMASNNSPANACYVLAAMLERSEY